MARASILKKTIQVGIYTFISRVFGAAREILFARYLGKSALSDAFVIAFRLPNMMRKIFAEGALSAAVTPTIVHEMRSYGPHAVSRLLGLLFLIIEGFLLGICMCMWWYAAQVLTFVAPGFSQEQLATAIPLLQILIFYIFFISSSALVASALQAVHHFFVPAAGQILLNSIVVAGLLVCIAQQLPVADLAWIMLIASCAHTFAHIIAYIYEGFSIALPDKVALHATRSVLKKFIPCVISVSPMEIIALIDGQFASYLPEGSVTLITYATNLMRIPLGVFVVAFSTILLPFLSHIGSYAPKRLSFYLLESTKFIFWVTVPAALVMGFFSYKIFYTVYLSENFTIVDVAQASSLLIVALAGLFFFSLNKILVNMYYALHMTTIPAIITGIAVLSNIGLNAILMGPFGTVGLVGAMSISAALQALLLLAGLWYYGNFKFYTARFAQFLYAYCTQLLCILTLFYGLHFGCELFIQRFLEPWAPFLLYKIGYWVWVGPLCGALAIIILFTRKYFGVQLYFMQTR